MTRARPTLTLLLVVAAGGPALLFPVVDPGSGPEAARGEHRRATTAPAARAVEKPTPDRSSAGEGETPRPAPSSPEAREGDPSPARRPGAGEASDRAADPIAELGDADPIVRLRAVLALREDRSERATRALHRLLQRERAPVVRAACADALSARGALAPPEVTRRAGDGGR